VPGKDVEPEIRSMSRMHNIFKFIFESNKHIEYIYLATESGIFFEYPWEALPSGYDPRKRDWFTNTLKKDGTGWTGPYVSAFHNKLVMTYARKIPAKGKNSTAVIAADVNVEVISNEFISTQLKRSGYAFLLDSEGNILAREGLGESPLKWDSEYQAENLFRTEKPELKKLAARMTAGKHGIIRHGFNNHEDFFIAYAPVPASNWSIAIAVPVSEAEAPALRTESEIKTETLKNNRYIAEYINHKLLLYALICVFLVLLATVAGLLLSAKITTPVKILTEGAAKIGRGDLDVCFSLKTGDEIEDLAKTFNRMAGDLKKYIKNLQETTVAREHMRKELMVAREIQASMLPSVFPPFPERNDIDIHALMKPAREVGGDFYDFFFLDEQRLFFCIGDVSGKGIPAALFMAAAKNVLKGATMNGLSPSEILFNANSALEKGNDACMFVTVFCGILNTCTGKTVIASAGHNPPLYGAEGKNFKYLEIPHGPAIGPLPFKKADFSESEIILATNDILFMYTDGVTEAMNSDNKIYSPERLSLTLNTSDVPADPRRIIDVIIKSVEEYASPAPRSDDITMLALKC
jgi:sigma-B regulation protein RsbU (phosphoserine phosphatase)